MLNFDDMEYEEEKIQLSGVKIYPEQYFKSYEVNDDASVYTFEVNPASASISNEMNAAMVKLLDGGYRRDTFSPRARLNIKVNFPKITEEMRLKLISWYENGEVIGLVDDLKVYREGFIVPGSFNTPRRKTTKSEQEQETSSYSADFAFQER